MKTLGGRRIAADVRALHPLLRQTGVLTRSQVDTWDQLSMLHYDDRALAHAHFRQNGAGRWKWAGGVFSTPTVTLDTSLMTVDLDPVTRAFLYWRGPVTSHDKMASVALISPWQTLAIGVRLDAGNDNNYAEVVLVSTQTTPTQWSVEARLRTGGGPITAATGDAMSVPVAYVVRMELIGTFWSAWGFYPALHTPFGIRGKMYKPLTDLGNAGLNFTPTRMGIIFDNNAVETASTVVIDWAQLDYNP